MPSKKSYNLWQAVYAVTLSTSMAIHDMPGMVVLSFEVYQSVLSQTDDDLCQLVVYGNMFHITPFKL